MNTDEVLNSMILGSTNTGGSDQIIQASIHVACPGHRVPRIFFGAINN